MDIERLCPGCMNDNGGESVCSICGYDMSSKNDSSFLPVRFLLSERYIIGKAIAVNTEGVTYIAWDNAANSAVHIKEYFPKGISTRNPDKTVSVIGGKEFNFNEGLMSFIETNKKLIATELQSIVPVLTVFEENGTVYAAMPIISGITLGNFLERNGGSLRWEQARPLFLPLIDTIKGLHDMGIIHGGISPETIIVGRDGKLRLTGLCIPQLRMASQDSPTELYNGYAAVEQYGKLNAVLSVAVDVYALSAVLFRVIIGTVPPSSESRLAADTLSVPARFADELPRQVLVAIANGLQIKPQNRTANIEKFKNELVYGETPENLRRASVSREAAKTAEPNPVPKPEKKKGSSAKNAILAAVITILVFLIAGGFLFYKFKDTLFPPEEEVPSINASAPDAISTSEDESSDDITEQVKTYEVQNLIGMSRSDAEKISEGVVIVTADHEEYSDVEKGKICKQSIPAGEKVTKDTIIEVTLSLGPKEFEMPNYMNENKVYTDEEIEELKEELEEKFRNGTITIAYRTVPAKPYGVIVDQFPKAGEIVEANANVTIYLNDANKPEPEPEFEMPNYVDYNTVYTEEEIKEKLEELFYSGNITILYKTVPSRAYGVVVDQDPAAGEIVTADTNVTIYLNDANKPNE